MKKKAIEKIPYLKLKKVSRRKSAKYVGVTAVKIVGHEKHLFLEVYRNGKKTKDVPLVRIVATKKDFGTFFPESGEWSRRRVCTDGGYGEVLWNGSEDPGTWKGQQEANVLQSTEDLERIKKFCGGTVYNEARWWKYIDQHEGNIVVEERRQRENRKYERRQAALEDRIRHEASIYADYLAMRENRGYDLTNTVYQYPRDLNSAHAKMVEEVNKEAKERRLREVAVAYPNIRNSYRSLRKKYYYEDDIYIIRPARSAEEIVLEGRQLHHCVGGNWYLDRHNQGETYILMLRFKKTPEIPYITVEIDARIARIIQ